MEAEEKKKICREFEDKFQNALELRNQVLQEYDFIKNKVTNLLSDSEKLSEFMDSLEPELREKKDRWRVLADKHKPVGVSLGSWMSYLAHKKPLKEKKVKENLPKRTSFMVVDWPLGYYV
jgi:hypothetical protein